MTMFEKAKKSQSMLRLGLVGPSGSGKTMTALRVANGLADGRQIAVIDTEHRSASLYADCGIDFSVCNLDRFDVDSYIDAIRAAESGGFAVCVIDSLSHAWAGKGGILEFVDQQGKRSGGGSFAAWRDATPRHNALIECLLSAKMHIIATLRSKVEHVVETVNGRTQVRKVGLQPVQREGLEYEFTICGDINQEHEFVVTKTRAKFLKDAVIREAGEELGRQLLAWLNSGEEPQQQQTPPFKANPKPVDISKTLTAIGNANAGALDSLRAKVAARHGAGEITDDQRRVIDNAIAARIEMLATPAGGAS